MFKHQPTALETMYSLLESRTPLNPKRYCKGQPVVVKALYEYFDNLLVGGEQDLRLIAPDVVLELVRNNNECVVTLYKGGKSRTFTIGGMNWSIRNDEDTQEHFFSMVIESMVHTMDFVKAIDDSAKYKALSMCPSYAAQTPNNKPTKKKKRAPEIIVRCRKRKLVTA